MTESEIQKLLGEVRRGKLEPAAALERLRRLPFEDLGFAKIDHHRSLRQGFAEVIFAPGKRPEQVVSVVRRMLKNRHNVLITRGDRKLYHRIKRVARAARFHELSGVISIRKNNKILGKGLVLVISAGTSDIPVAEEALVTAEVLGNRVEALYDVGVAGLHRLLDRR
ncbi:MAG: AIR carboxylase family protein, partial [Terriglobia bacterium]